MKFMRYGKDGGKDSKVWGFWFLEIKSLFSVVLLCFDEGSREAFHSHAFNAYTWFLTGSVDEHHITGEIITWTPSLVPKYTPRSCFHKVYPKKRTYALSVRGPWNKTWMEFDSISKTTTTLSNGRVVVERCQDLQTINQVSGVGKPRAARGLEGLEGLRVGNADALEIRIGYYANLICNAPG